jgi:hypothetical protein
MSEGARVPCPLQAAPVRHTFPASECPHPRSEPPMADIFNEREKGYEAKFKLDSELRFKAQSRSNKLFGQWLGEKLGLSEAEREAYGKELVMARLNAPVREELIKKIMKDIAARKANITEHEVRKELDRLYAVALEQIAKDQGKK